MIKKILIPTDKSSGRTESSGDVACARKFTWPGTSPQSEMN